MIAADLYNIPENHKHNFTLLANGTKQCKKCNMISSNSPIFNMYCNGQKNTIDQVNHIKKMTNTQQDIINKLSDIRNKYPDLRFGQLLFAVGILTNIDDIKYQDRLVCKDIFNTRDTIILDKLKIYKGK